MALQTEPGRPTRLLVLAVVVAQLVLIAAPWVLGPHGTEPVLLCWGSPAVVLLAAHLLMARPPSLSPVTAAYYLRAFGLSLAAVVLGIPYCDGRTPFTVMEALMGVFVGMALSSVFLPLLMLVDRWRRRRWTSDVLTLLGALAVCAVFAELFLLTSRDLRHSVSARSSLGLCAMAVVLAVVALVAEVRWVVRIRRALAGAVPGAHLEPDLSSDAVPDWSLVPGSKRLALVVDRPATGYRDQDARTIVAMVPTSIVLSWRLLVLPAVVVAAIWAWC